METNLGKQFDGFTTVDFCKVCNGKTVWSYDAVADQWYCAACNRRFRVEDYEGAD